MSSYITEGIIHTDFKVYTIIGYGGNGSIIDTVTVSGIPAQRKVFLFEQQSMRLIAITWSDTEGNYAFYNLPIDIKFIVMGIDYQKQFQPDTLMDVTAS